MAKKGLALLSALIIVASAGGRAEKPDLPDLGQLRYRFIGPPGNRAIAVAGEPGNLNVYYVGAASGGIWKSVDGGITWRPIFDGQPASSVGALAIAPSDPNVVWAGTGETFIRSNISIGDGIYKSTDAGRTWTHMGLDRTGRIGRILVDPHNPDIVFAAALGHCYGPQPERGVYRTMDGGRTWDRVLFVDENTGASDIAMDPRNPRVLVAGMWQVDIKTWGRESGGPGSGVFLSRDGGTTWKRTTGHGLPEPPLGKIAVAVAPSNGSRLYALIETGQRGSLWRSDDGGENWRLVNHSRLLNERPHYYTRMLVSPLDDNEVYFPSNSMSVTYDGGETTELVRWGGDNHDMWADPTNADRMMIGNDLGVMITTTHGRQWNAVRLPIGQMYHVDTDTRVPYFVYGNMQDYSSVRGPSNSLNGRDIPPALWTTTAGCESGWSIVDPVDQDIVWGGCYAGALERYDIKTRHARSVSVWPERTMGAPAGEVKYRMNWTFPIAISPHDHDTVYVGSQYVHKTTDGGQTWTIISPDLSTNDKSKLGDSGGLTLDNLSVEYYSLVFVIAESPLEKGQIWAGTNDGQVQVTRDGGAHWTNVTANIPALPPSGTVSSIEPSKYDAGACYIAVDLHQVNNRDPWVYKTADYGKTWKSISSDIPRSVFSYAHVVREDPVRKGLLYLGTENSLFVSFNDGANWYPLQTNLPHAPVHWLTIQPRFNDLVVGTYGRGFWILDDVTPLQQMSQQVLDSRAHLFAVRAAYRFATLNRNDLSPNAPATGQNPPYGADITYYLKTAATGPVEVTILDGAGKTVRTLRAPGQAGVNRIWWDLRYEPTRDPQLRTTPPGNPHVWEEKRFRGIEWRPISYYGLDAITLGPRVATGTYAVRLKVDGRELTRPLDVLKDPSTLGTEADIQKQVALSLDIRDRVNTVVDMVNRLEWVRKQVDDLKKALKEEKNGQGLTGEADKLDSAAQAVEDQLIQKTLAEADQKSFRGPIQLYLKWLWLAAEVGAGGADISGGADFAPTAAELEVHEVLSKRLEKVKTEYDEFVNKTVPAFNETMRQKGVGVVIVKRP